MNLPNSLTVTRIFLVPLLVVVLLTKFEGRMIFGVREELVGASGTSRVAVNKSPRSARSSTRSPTSC
jgi:phosphatidylglycerophosphate synthase